jgi:hypothetical protein
MRKITALMLALLLVPIAMAQQEQNIAKVQGANLSAYNTTVVLPHLPLNHTNLTAPRPPPVKINATSPPTTEDLTCPKPLRHDIERKLCCYFRPNNIDKYIRINCTIEEKTDRNSSLCCFNETLEPLEIKYITEHAPTYTKTTKYVAATSQVLSVATVNISTVMSIPPTTQPQTQPTTASRPTTTTILPQQFAPSGVMIMASMAIVVIFLIVVWRLGKEDEDEEELNQGENT